LVADDAFM